MSIAIRRCSGIKEHINSPTIVVTQFEHVSLIDLQRHHRHRTSEVVLPRPTQSTRSPSQHQPLDLSIGHNLTLFLPLLSMCNTTTQCEIALFDSIARQRSAKCATAACSRDLTVPSGI